MKKIILVRIFAFFPLSGVLIPDVACKFISPSYQIPLLHIGICSILFLTIIASFAIEKINVTNPPSAELSKKLN